MFARIDHVGLVAASFEDAQALLQDTFELELDESRSPMSDGVYFAPEQTTAYFYRVGDGLTQVEVLIPEKGTNSGTLRFLERSGPGLHHICYACEDIDAEAERLLASGLTEIVLPRTADGRRTAAFFHPNGAGGVLTELVPMRLSDLPGSSDGWSDTARSSG